MREGWRYIPTFRATPSALGGIPRRGCEGLGRHGDQRLGEGVGGKASAAAHVVASSMTTPPRMWRTTAVAAAWSWGGWFQSVHPVGALSLPSPDCTDSLTWQWVQSADSMQSVQLVQSVQVNVVLYESPVGVSWLPEAADRYTVVAEF
jgi:hypothetical protein